MEDVKPEEKSPLLLYMVENDGSPSRNNKRVNFDKGRLYGISSGATAVFTEFPDFLSPCWITALLSSLIFFIMVLLMVSSAGPSGGLRVPRCTHGDSENLDNKTIHLVHRYGEWTEEQLNILQKIKEEYDGYAVHLVLVQLGFKHDNEIAKLRVTELPLMTDKSSSSSPHGTSVLNQNIIEIKRVKRSKKNLRTLKRKKHDRIMENVEPLGIGFGVKSLLNILLNSKIDSSIVKRNISDINFIKLTEPTFTTPVYKAKTLNEVIQDFPGLTIRNVTLEEVFRKSPLQRTWYKLSDDLAIFALRVLHLWQYGGLSFKIDGSQKDSPTTELVNFSIAPHNTLHSSDPVTAHKLLTFIQTGRQIYEHLPKEIVKADDEASYMFTKTPCHVFFGDILMNLRKASGIETPKHIIQTSLKLFCNHSAVGNNYCNKFIRQNG